MAATNNAAVWQNMQTKLQGMGGVTAAVIGEPRQAVQSGTVAIIPMDGQVDEVVLNAPRELHAVALRRYEATEQEPTENIELRLDEWRAEILEDIFGDFDLGGTIAYPEAAQTTWLYENDQLNNVNFRTLDVMIVYRIDPSATFSE